MNAPEHACAHAYREDDGLQLEIDCTECNGAHDLANNKCLVGVVNAMASASSPEAIVLRRYIDKRYRGDAVEAISACSAELASLNRSLSLKTTPSDRRCRTCGASRVNVIACAKRLLLDNPAAYLRERRLVRREVRESMIAAAEQCPDAAACVDAAIAETSLSQEADAGG